MAEPMNRHEIKRYFELARDELVTARDNLNLGHFRTATSRAYYAMFYSVTAVLGSRGEWRSKHQGAISAFGEMFVKNGQVEPEYGRLLHTAFSTRLRSDYEPGAAFDADFVERYIVDAEIFVRRMEQIIGEQGS